MTAPSGVWMRLKNRAALPAVARSARALVIPDIRSLAALNNAATGYEPGAHVAAQLDEAARLIEAAAALIDDALAAAG